MNTGVKHEFMKLTCEQANILKLIAMGSSNCEIAGLLNKTEYKIRQAVKKLLNDFSAKNKVQLVVIAIRENLI